MKQLVIFDLDGTLLNTIADLGAAANHALGEMGYPQHSPLAYPSMVGGGVRRLMQRALPDSVGSRDDVVDEALRIFRNYYDGHLADSTEPYPGIAELLDELTARGVRVAVASNKYEAAVRRLISDFFPNVEWAAVCGQVEGVPVKPDPSVVFRVLSEAPAPKQGVLYVGDSGVDMETARRACVDSVGVTWGFRSAAELRAHYAMYVVSDPSEILDLAIKDD
ncbi:MAG: HAD family hydrolase [Muribaculaceae bacterium]|nr:HAD family hydrolase [Muribaculaceae bacterium]